MTRKTVKRAGMPSGGYVLSPPLGKAEAEAVFQSSIPDAAWLKIERAFCEHGRSLRALKATPANRAKNGWEDRQTRTVRAIEDAMGKLEYARSQNKDFLWEASDNYSIENSGVSSQGDTNAHRLLNDAYEKLLLAIIIVERAQPLDIETPTEFEARRILLRKVRDALQGAGCKCEQSSGHRFMSLPDGPSEADLTPFEQLVNALEIHEAPTPLAAAKWIQRATAGTE